MPRLHSPSAAAAATDAPPSAPKGGAPTYMSGNLLPARKLRDPEGGRLGLRITTEGATAARTPDSRTWNGVAPFSAQRAVT